MSPSFGAEQDMNVDEIWLEQNVKSYLYHYLTNRAMVFVAWGWVGGSGWGMDVVWKRWWVWWMSKGHPIIYSLSVSGLTVLLSRVFFFSFFSVVYFIVLLLYFSSLYFFIVFLTYISSPHPPTPPLPPHHHHCHIDTNFVPNLPPPLPAPGFSVAHQQDPWSLRFHC